MRILVILYIYSLRRKANLAIRGSFCIDTHTKVYRYKRYTRRERSALIQSISTVRVYIYRWADLKTDGLARPESSTAFYRLLRCLKAIQVIHHAIVGDTYSEHTSPSRTGIQVPV